MEKIGSEEGLCSDVSQYLKNCRKETAQEGDTLRRCLSKDGRMTLIIER